MTSLQKSSNTITLSLPKPVLTFLKWLELTAGRDKMLRLIAYFSKYLVQTMKLHGVSADVYTRFAKGASSVGQTRKLIRFFKSLEYLQEFLKAFKAQDDFERYASMTKALSLGLWMVMDHIQWLQKAGYLKFETMKKIDEIHSQAWFTGLLMGVALCIYHLNRVQTEESGVREEMHHATTSASRTEAEKRDLLERGSKQLAAIEKSKNKYTMGVIKNGVDLIIPAARLGWLQVSDGTVGLAGTLTSLIGIYDTWPKSS